ncbi:MAG: hypothetical protein AAGE65_05040 [Planctomycetota bacterium]
MTTPQNNSLGWRYARLVQSMPTICPPTAPTIVGAIAIGLTIALGHQWIALIVALVLIAFAPQWDSCPFGLMDFMTCIALAIVGIAGLLKLLAA